MEKVSVVKCNSYTPSEVRKALKESLKNINFSFKKNMKVLIKPNLLMSAKPEIAITTHPTVLEELCKILIENEVEIFIGESSGVNTEKALNSRGIRELNKYAKIINFDNEETLSFDLGTPQTSTVPIAKIIFDMDLIINVAKLKTHGYTNVTLAVKNLYGCIPGNIKGKYHKTIPNPKDFAKFLVNLQKIIKPQLNIIDGIVGLEGEGPGMGGIPIKSNVLIAGNNAFAIDVIASEIMGFESQNIYTNKFSGISKKDIQIIGEQNIRFSFKKPNSFKQPVFRFIARFLPKPQIKFNRDKCNKCHICENKCPVSSIKLNPWPGCDHKSCIKCLCCMEVCPHNAVDLKDSIIILKLKEIIKRILKK